ncbi:MAG: hypothetical protein Q9195_007345 [Heterodermia aff. obscurata]
MVNVNGNQVTLALSVVAAVIVVASLIALFIRELRYKRKHCEEEKMLNAETDNTSIELPARGFSLLRAFSHAGHNRASAEPQDLNRTSSKGTSMLRSLSRLASFRSKRNGPTRDLESQITAYRSPSAAQIRDGIRSTAGTSNQVQSPRPIYQSRNQQWTRISLHSPRSFSEMAHNVPSPLSPNHPIVSPISPDFQIS